MGNLNRERLADGRENWRERERGFFPMMLMLVCFFYGVEQKNLQTEQTMIFERCDGHLGRMLSVPSTWEDIYHRTSRHFEGCVLPLMLAAVEVLKFATT